MVGSRDKEPNADETSKAAGKKKECRTSTMGRPRRQIFVEVPLVAPEIEVDAYPDPLFAAPTPGFEEVADNMCAGKRKTEWDASSTIAPAKKKTYGEGWMEMSCLGNTHKFKFNNMKVVVTLSEADKEVNLKAPRTGEIAAKAADLCESLKQWIKNAYPPTA